MVRPLRALVLVALLLAPTVFAQLPARVAAPAPAPTPPGVTALDVSSILLRLAKGDRGALDALAPLAAEAPHADVPPALLAPVLSPPPLADTLPALARSGHAATPEAALAAVRTHPLPADVERAISGLGQAVLGATTLQQQGHAYAGAALLEQAIATYRRPLQRETILLSYHEAYSGLAWDEGATRAQLAATLSARDPRAALAAAGVPLARPPVDLAPVSAEIALAYARLGLPVDASVRAELARADALDPRLRAPLATALAYETRALAERDAATARVSPADLAILHAVPDVERALAAPDPSAAQLALLVAYGEAASRVDRAGMLAGEGDLLAASDVLQPLAGVAFPEMDPANDTIYRDPYGLVVVTGTGSTWTRPFSEGRLVRTGVPGAPTLDPSAGANETLARIDALLARDPTRGVWPWASQLARQQLPGGALGASDITVHVNAANAQLFHLDLGGDDIYETNAGGTGDAPLWTASGSTNAQGRPLPAALLVDLGGNDTYLTSGASTIGSADLGLALLVDSGGRDAFLASREGSIASARAGGVAALVHGEGDATFVGVDAAVAHADGAGTAVLVSAGGSDRYQGGNASLAASDLGAVASLTDLGGDDVYLSGERSMAWSSGGLAALVDASGNDTYEPANLSSAEGDAADGAAARIAVLLDAGGADHGACPDGALRNAAIGSMGVERAPAHAQPFAPAFGACIDARLAPAAPVPASDGSVWLPPTFFTSSFANFTLPGLVNVGGLGDDVVHGPFALSVDILGNDSYDTGAIAAANVSRAQAGGGDLGLISPVSLLLDTDGNDTFTGANGSAFADGGIAVQATLWSRTTRDSATDEAQGQLFGAPSRVAALTAGAQGIPSDPSRAPSFILAAGAGAREDVPWAVQNATANVTLDHPSGAITYRGVRQGLGAAQANGVALLLNDGDSTIVADAPSGATCRLACARSGGAAMVLSQGGNGDLIRATPGSLGATYAGGDGGVALYDHRGGPDRFVGSNVSMGVVLGDDASAPGSRPAVALFVKDGWDVDAYDANMTTPGPALQPRGNDAAWMDAETQDGLAGKATRAMHVAEGIDDLGWWLDMQQHALDRGTAPNGPDINAAGARVHPGDPLRSSSILTPQERQQVADQEFLAAGTLDKFAHQHDVQLPVHGVGLAALADTAYGYLQEGGPTVTNKYATPNGTMSQDQSGQLPMQDPGAGGSLAGPFGLRPVTLARTALSPIVSVSALSDTGDAPSSFNKTNTFQNLSGAVEVLANIGNPPLDADETAQHAGNDTANSSIVRVELVVKGIDPSWTTCRRWEDVDPLDPSACVVAWWDRRVDNPHHDVFATGTWDSTTRLAQWKLLWSTTDGCDVCASPIDRAFPTGNYSITVRAFAQRADGRSVSVLGVNDLLVDATFADASGFTSDPYAYFGGSYSLSYPVYNQPFAGEEIIRDSNGTRPIEVHLRATEPVTFHADFVDEQGQATRVPATGELASNGTSIDLAWDPGRVPDQRYQVVVSLTSVVSQLPGSWPADPTLTHQYVFVDRVAPPSLADARARIPSVVAAEAPDGRFDLPVLMDPDDTRVVTVPLPPAGSPVMKVHLWAQEDILDPADPTHVLQSLPWRFMGDDAHPSRTWAAQSGDNADEYHVKFPGDPRPGPPRIYRIAAFAEDRAGNVRPQTPTGPDCIDGACAEIHYDITPPRTKLALVSPSPDLARIRNGTIRLRVDANETPDVASLDTFVLPLRRGSDAAFEALRAGRDVPQPAGEPASNVTLGLPFAAAAPLALAGDAIGLDVNVTNKGGEFLDQRPLWFDVNVTDADGNTTSTQVPFTDVIPTEYEGILGNDSVTTLRFTNLQLPDVAGVTTITIAVNTTLTPDVLPSQHTFGILAWERVAHGGPRDTDVAWTPDPRALQDGTKLLFLERGTDLVGNVEPKVEYDQRVDVDLAPPTLAAAPVLSPQATTLGITLSTSEPASVLARVVDTNGTLAASTLDDAGDADHTLNLDGLAPDHAYSLTLTLTDLVGNAQDVAPIAFHTSRLADVTLGPLPALAAQPFNLTWTSSHVSATDLLEDVSLSTDGGRSWTDLTPGGLHVAESEGATHAFPIDPRMLPESTRAELRVTIRAAEGAAGASSVISAPFTLDGVPPRSTVTAAAGLGSWAGSDVTLHANATDGASGVAAIEWSADNATFRPVPNGTLVVNATRDVYVRARDVAGNLEPTRRYHVQIDRDPPTLALSAPWNVTRADLVPVTIRADDALSGLASVTLSGDGLASPTTLGPAAFVGGVATFLWAPGDAGARALHAVATDGAGNQASADVPLLVDRAPPVGAITLLARTPTGARLVADFSKPVAIQATLASAAGDAPLDVDAALATSHELVVSGLRPGAIHAVLVTATDAAGNIARVSFALDTPPDAQPPSAPSRVAATPHADGSVTLSWGDATDDSGITSYVVLRQVDDGAFAPLANVTGATFYADDATVDGATLSYEVEAVDVAGNVGPAATSGPVQVARAPRILAVTASAGMIRVTLDAPADVALLVGGNATPCPAPTRDAEGTFTTERSLSADVTRLDAPQSYHIVATRGAFSTRWPPLDDAPLPVVTRAASGAPPGGLLSTRVVPGVGLALLVAAALGLALARRRAR